MKVIRAEKTSDFETRLKEALSEEGAAVFAVFFGSEQDTGESWCPDCVIADPLIRAVVREVPNSILLECPVGDRADYKNKPEHPYRTHPGIRLTSVPTLIRWTAEGPQERVVDPDCADKAKLIACAESAKKRKAGFSKI
eukprot:TRINITY_DN3823_c0_g1_i2.p2 TRINITY_DN3823_c0_g1~~TRINITY_DN3823_c0_g1_i2.p2  ORF type:complete len:139 (+),score=27.39 TRINITY_DN3823_c0_g1_i2:523-939(+)